MDNMAYLQQIAVGGNNSANAKKDKNGILSKIFNIWTLAIGGGVILLLIIIVVIAGALNKVDTKDQDLMTQSYWASKYLNEKTLSEYAGDIKNSDIRNMTASLRSVLNEIVLNEENLLLSEYGIEADDTEENELAMKELERIDGPEEGTTDLITLDETLEEGRLNGILDRTFLREMTLQIAILISYQSECAERTKNSSVKDFSSKAESNLQNLYDQFYNFKSPTV